MSKACMNVSDLAGTIYDGCRITKGNQLTKNITKASYLNHLKNLL